LASAAPLTTAPPAWDTVAIVGVGLIGGSIGRALLERGLAKQVVGIGRRAASLRAAKKVGAVTSTTLDLARGVARANLVVVCTPVEQIAAQALVALNHAPAGALITDAGSTKQQIVAAVEKKLSPGGRFVGSHPMAGSEKSGPGEARADLFVGRAVIVTPTKKTPAADTEAVGEFWAALGARVFMMSPEAHDRAVAGTSHLPHLISALLAAVTRSEDAPLIAGGWLDTTRVAGGDPELWRQILQSNDQQVLAALAQFEKQLSSARRALERGDGARLAKLLAQGKAVRDALGN
jgi:prephenate dehydrogenase